MSKYKDARERHAKLRAYERYDVELNHSDRKKIIEIIKNDRSKCIKTLSNSRKIHLVHYKSQDYVVIYSNRLKTLLTFLPKDCEEYIEHLKSTEHPHESQTAPTIE